MKIVTLTTCHNRREHTINALSCLQRQKLPANVELKNVLVNDASDDGTIESVKRYFTDIEIIDGTGDLYWAGGMRYGWEQSIRYKNFDYLFVYNDDVTLEVDAILKLIETSLTYTAMGGIKEHIIVGAFCSMKHGRTTYSGVRRTSSWHPLRFEKVDPQDKNYIAVDTLNMNAALISNHVLNKIGFLSDYFVHNSADYDYGLKLIKSGGAILLCPGYLGFCETNDDGENYINDSTSLISCYKNLLSIKNEPIKQRMLYYAKHAGFFWPLLWLMPYFTLPFKYVWIKYKRLRII